MDEDNAITYPDLPVSRKRDEIMAAMREHQVVIIVGETGSGKTTQLPKMALELARERFGEDWARGVDAERAGDRAGDGVGGRDGEGGEGGEGGVGGSGGAGRNRRGGPRGRRGEFRGKLTRVGCTQPRRIAASSVARRVAEELGESLGETVGYQVRFEEKLKAGTRVKFMTDGIMLAETQNDPDLRQYHTIILDEVHERSLNIDFLLGYLKLLLARRPDLKLVLSSATLDSGGLADFFDGAPVVHVEGRTFPVEIEYLPPRGEDEETTEHVVRAIDWISAYDAKGDVLVFLPGEREIRECAELLKGRNYAGTDILPLFARLGLADQQKVFHPSANRRRIVLATNVAETSLTIPGIIYVVDSGWVRMSRYSPQRQIQRLQVEPVSRASARQRAGRCGRICEGVCVRLYDAETFDDRPEFTDPEIRRSSLAAVILRMKALNLPELGEFPLPNPPAPRLVTEGYRTLREIGALDRQKELTDMGRQIARLPLDPRLGRMLLAARKEQSLAEILVVVAALTVMDPRERPQDKAQQADQAHAQWRDAESDFATILKIWQALGEFRSGKSGWRRNPLRQYCQKNFLNMRRVIEWDNLHGELLQLVDRQFHWKNAELDRDVTTWASGARLHKAILAGAPRQFGVWNPETREYRAPGGRAFAIFPGSGLFRRKTRPEWVMGCELVETTRLWMRRCCLLDPAWIEQVAPHLCEIRHSGAHYNPDQGVVQAIEQVICGGITIVPKRRVHFGRIDPAGARKIFLTDALIGGQMKQKPTLLRRLEDIHDEVRLMEAKLRLPDQLWCEDAVFDWFNANIPEACATDREFHEWFRALDAGERKSWHLAVDDVMYRPSSDFPLSGFPEKLRFGRDTLILDYLCAPGAPDDGVTMSIHLDQLNAIPDWLPGWGVPGHLAERCEHLMRALPKELRVALQPVSEAAAEFAALWRDVEPDGPLPSRLADFIETRTRKPCYPDWVQPTRLPDWMTTHIEVVDDNEKTLGFGNDLAALRDELRGAVDDRFQQQAHRHWEESGLTDFPEEPLPETVEIGPVTGYPALVDESLPRYAGKQPAAAGKLALGVRVFDTPQAAQAAHRTGCVALAMHAHAQQVAHLRKRLPLSLNARLGLTVLGKDPARNAEDLTRCAVNAAILLPGGKLPRSREEFAAISGNLRQNLFDHAQTLARLLDPFIEAETRIREFVAKHAKMRWYDQIARDIDQQLAWSLRPGFLWDAGPERWVDILRYAQATLARIDRLAQQPVARDIDKLEQFSPLWQAWTKLWRQSPEDPVLVELGYRIDEVRVSLFAPNTPVKGKVSLRKVMDELPPAK